MNLILFDPEEIARKIAAGDTRAHHLLRVLKRGVGETFDAGMLNGPVGKGRITAVGDDGLSWEFSAGVGAAGAESAPPQIEMIVGLPRPQTARKILQEATALGVRAIRFVHTEKGDASYATSTLWKSGEWRRHVRAGLEQAFATREPAVTHGSTLEEAWAEASPATAIALDNYEATEDLGAVAVTEPIVLAVGGERGWSGCERDFFRSQGAVLAHLGRRVLRTETACVAALSITAARLRRG